MKKALHIFAVNGRSNSGDYFLGTFMTFNNMALTDIEMVHMSPKQIQEATSYGTVDAGITWEPYAHRIEKALGEGAVRFAGQSGQEFHSKRAK